MENRMQLVLLVIIGLSASAVTAMMIEGEQMSIDDAIIKAGSKEGMTKMYEIMQDEKTVMVELDMLYNMDKYMEMRKDMSMETERDNEQGSRKKRKAIIPVYYRWENARVPYEISYEFYANERQLIEAAIADYNRYTCIRFVPATRSDRNRVRFQNGGGCSSYVGMIGGVQPISLASGCRYKGIIIHEMGHAIGFQHEQTRADRDGFVSIDTRNIQYGLEYNFMKYSRSQVENYGVPYDYTSVMHYSQYAFTNNGRPTIYARDQRYQSAMGNREGLSFNDIRLANEMYQCAEQRRCQPRQCPTGAFQGQDCKCWCNSGDRSNPVKECDGSGVVVTESPIIETTTMSRMSCEDDHQYCPQWAEAGFCTGEYEDYMMQSCKFSCNYCDMTTTTTTTMATPPIANCEDESRYCSYWAEAGECSRNPSYMMAYCKRSCNACEGMTTRPSCRDTNSYCPYWTDYCSTNEYRDYLRMNCEKSCGYCRSSDEERTTAATATTTVAPADPSCMDSRSENYCKKNAYRCGRSPTMSTRCRKTCNMCN